MIQPKAYQNYTELLGSMGEKKSKGTLKSLVPFVFLMQKETKGRCLVLLRAAGMRLIYCIIISQNSVMFFYAYEYHIILEWLIPTT